MKERSIYCIQVVFFIKLTERVITKLKSCWKLEMNKAKCDNALCFGFITLSPGLSFYYESKQYHWLRRLIFIRHEQNPLI